MSSNFPEALKNLRTKRGITQAELADSIGVAKSTISMYEVGAREPDFEMLETLADFFNVNLITLVSPDEEKAYASQQGERNMAQTEDEEDMLLLARHMEPLSEEDREMLKAQFRSTIDVYLKRKAQGPSGSEDK